MTEKKVEYIELIYDLIFVYIIGRNNSLIEHVSPAGFVEMETYITYILATLVVLTIWYHSTLLINRYGKNDVGQHICLFVNMYLLYFMADSTSVHWQHFYVRYNLAWALILLNLSLHYFLCLHKITLEKRSSKTENQELRLERTAEEEQIRHSIVSLLLQALIAAAGIPGYFLTGLPLSLLAIPAGLMLSLSGRGRGHSSNVPVDFMHLTERVMLYIVFTFGEMVIAISGYFQSDFQEGITVNTIYFSLCAFLIVAGLFLSYGFVYNRILDREKRANETGYMFLHIFMIIALNNLSTALEFMREDAVAAVPKNVFLVASFLMYYLALFLMWIYAKSRQKADAIFLIRLIIGSTVFTVLMAHFYTNGTISVAISVIYIYAMFALIHLFWRSRIRGGKQAGAASAGNE
ncbi:MAG: low temperature requirement protein A [Lachnospiraceae bacterium]|nr:low temperature requirement protein A [Lachnospiraceae bacterium]